MKRVVMVAVLALLALAPVLPAVAAEEPKPAPFAENVKAMLDASVGRSVILQLASGQEISGTVTTVGDHVVQLSRVGGRDFYDALVRMDRVDAVLFRVRNR